MYKQIDDGGIMSGKGQLGIKRVSSSSIPKMSKSETRTGDAKTNSVIHKKMKKVMSKVMKGC